MSTANTLAPASRDAIRGFSLPQVSRPTTLQTLPPPAPDAIRAQQRLLDSHGRTIRDLRLSITDRCNFRCVYCMEPDTKFMPGPTLLDTHELVRIAAITHQLGIRKIRLTGGEPTLHPDLPAIIAGIRNVSDIEIAIITNASNLTRERAREWKLAGLDRVTISLDSLQPDRFASLTRSATRPARILDAIETCLSQGLTPLKVNAVMMQGINDDEAADLATLARHYAIHVRFIEFMPLDSARSWNTSRLVSSAKTRQRIESRFTLVPHQSEPSDSTSRNFTFADGAPGTIGFISPVTDPFCGACSRLRITADGKVRPCLFSATEWNMRDLLRSGADDARLAEFLIDATWTKQARHGITDPDFAYPHRPMSAIGG